MSDTVNIVPYTGPALDCAGPGYFEGVCTAAGEPQQNVMIQAVHSVTGAPAGHTVSGPDGRWRLEGVNPTMDFDILYRGEAIGKYGQIHQKRRPILDNNISFYPDIDPHIKNVDLLTFVEGGELKNYTRRNYSNGSLGLATSSHGRLVSEVPVSFNESWPFKEGIELNSTTGIIKSSGSIIDVYGSTKYTLEITFTPYSVMRGKKSMIFSTKNGNYGDEIGLCISENEKLQFYHGSNNFSTPIIEVDFDFSLWDKPVHFVISNDSKSSLVRDLYFFINGKMIINKTDLGMRLWIGSDTYRFKMSDVSGFGKFYGVFHNLRITRNVARYTKDFYPPNKQFPIIGP